MGQMRFQMPSAQLLPKDAVERAYLAGIEGIPWRSRNHWDDSAALPSPEFVIERSSCESGNLYIPWYTGTAGELVLSTASLMERAEPYHLPLELARGTVNRLRNQTADWQFMGLQLNEEFLSEQREIAGLFSQAVTCGQDFERATTLSAQTIDRAVHAIERLMRIYSEQATAARQCNSRTLPTFLSIRLEQGSASDEDFQAVTPAFNSAMVCMNWREIETVSGTYSWAEVDRQMDRCREHGLRIIGGPLLQLDRDHSPEWLADRKDDFDHVQAGVIEFARAAVERYRGKVHVWNCAARMNVDTAVHLSEEQRLRLVVAVIDEVQRLDSRTPYIISFEKPWAEYLVTAEHDFSPLHFADSLVRAELGLAGIGLEMNFGYWPEGSQHRDLLEISRVLDRWNMLGLPLLVFQSLPSGEQEDPQARIPVSPHASGTRCDADWQCNVAEQMLRLVLAKSFVHGYVWQDVSDRSAHEFAHGGLVDRQGQAKLLLQRFTELRQQYLS